MNIHLAASALLAAASLQVLPIPFLSSLAQAEPNCELRALHSPTVFPVRSQLRGHVGTVLIEVSIDQNGRATNTQLLQSSGYRWLDRAATTSVRKNWQFNTSGCEGKDLPATRTVAVEYRNAAYGH